MVAKWMLAGLSVGLLVNSAVFAYPCEPISRIETLAKNFALSVVPKEADDDKIEVSVRQLRSMARLAICTTEINASLPNNMSPTSITAVELTCNGERKWNILVPINLEVFTKVLVAKHNLQTNDIISDNDLEYASYNKNILYNGFFKNKEEAKGSQVPHFITAGTVLTERNIQKPVLVFRNQMTDIIVRKNSVVITMKGIAKSDGKLNEVIKIYNPSSKKLIDAVVVSSNKAEAFS